MRADCINSFDGAEIWTSQRVRDGIASFAITTTDPRSGERAYTELHPSHVRQLRDRCDVFLAEFDPPTEEPG